MRSRDGPAREVEPGDEMTPEAEKPGAADAAATPRRPSMASVAPTGAGEEELDHRGRMHRAKRQMSDPEARAFLRAQKIAHVATLDAQGWPYAVPLVYIYEGGDRLYLHTGDHAGHFLANVRHNPRICVEVSEIGPLHQGRPYACNSALVYTSVIAFGPVAILDDQRKKAWFLDQLLAKYGDSAWTFEPGYPLIHRIILYEQTLEVVTGKHSAGLSH